MVVPLYTKWQSQPTITTVYETNYPIWNINFPAITICSNNKIVKDSFNSLVRQQPWKNLTNGNDNFTENFYDALKGTVLFDDDPEILDELDMNTINIMNKYQRKIPLVLQKVMQSCSKLILACSWQGKTVPCQSLFSVRRTDDGYCCSFNTLRMSEQLYANFLKILAFQTFLVIMFLNHFSLDQNELESGIDDGEDDYNDYYYNECDYEGSGEDCNYESTTEYYESTTSDDGSGSGSGDGSCQSGWIGDDYCDDENNNEECTYDGGDCCGDNVKTDYCTICKCHETNTSSKSLDIAGKSLNMMDNPQASSGNETAKKKVVQPTKLKRINAATSKLGLSVLLHPDEDNYEDASLNNFVGFKVLVHSPYDFARVAAKGFTIDTKVEAFIASKLKFSYRSSVANFYLILIFSWSTIY